MAERDEVTGDFVDPNGFYMLYGFAEMGTERVKVYAIDFTIGCYTCIRTFKDQKTANWAMNLVTSGACHINEVPYLPH